MTFEEATRKTVDIAIRTPPWAETPGKFLCQLQPKNLEDPMIIDAQGMMDAIVKASQKWQRWHGKALLRVTSRDGSEIYLGTIRKL